MRPGGEGRSIRTKREGDEEDGGEI